MAFSRTAVFMDRLNSPIRYRAAGRRLGVVFAAGIILLLFLCPVFVHAQGWWWGSRIDSGYDAKTVLYVRGTVTAVSSLEQSGPVSLILRVESGQYTVMLATPRYLKRQGFRVERGDGLTIRGSRMLDGQGRAYIVAAVVTNEKTGEQIRLRDEGGVPLWSRKGQRGGKGFPP